MRIAGLFILTGLLSMMFGCGKSPVTPIKKPVTDTITIAKGADVGWLTEMEAAGVKFYDSTGTEMECMQLLKTMGINSIRLRAWVNPEGGWNGTKDLVVKALRAKNLGMKIMIDFHYSDSWADPGKQNKPAAWAALSFADLKTSLHDYTVYVMDTLKQVGITPEWVQIGNETNDGMLWPDGKASLHMDNFAALINEGYDAVKSVSSASQVIVHISNGYDNSLFHWMFDGLTANNARYDIIGMSLYPSYANTGWAEVDAQCLINMNDMVANYGKPVMLVEVGMPANNAEESKAFLLDIISKIRKVKNAKGLGVFYWEPECYSNWGGYGLGAFDNSGKPTAAMKAFK